MEGKMVYIQTLKGISDNFLQDCAQLYCEIWKEPPWNENFWKTEKVVNEIRSQMNYPGAEGYLAFENCEVIGFTWGYQIDLKDMVEISGSQEINFLFENGNKIFYVDELGVKKEYRHNEIGKGLTERILLSAKKNGSNLAILRTDKKAGAAKKLYRKIGFQDLCIRDANYPDRTYWLLTF
jgi:ribosomal protein S18 acetylase RimI-like enzyme